MTITFILFLFLMGCSNEAPPTREVISTNDAAGAVGAYSQAIKFGNTIYVSGQIGLIPGTKELVGDDVESQIHQAMKNISSILEAGGYSLNDIVSANVFLSDLDNYATLNEIYIQYFDVPPPARAVVEVSRIPLDAKVEIKVIAAK